jgi:hypothetical protein
MKNYEKYYLIFFIILILIIIILFKPTRFSANKRTFKSSIEPIINKKESLNKIKNKQQKNEKDFFTMGMILADNIDNEFVPEVMTHLTTAMELIEREDRITDDHEFMVRRAGDIHQIAVQNIVDIGDFELGLALDHAINGANNRVKTKSAENRLAIAQTKPTKQEKLEVLFEPTYTSDSQNTHERGVLNDTAAIINMLKGDCVVPPNPTHAITEIRDFAGDYLADSPHRHQCLQIALNKARESINIFALGENEDAILALVWSRANKKENKANCRVIREAVCDALIDCVDEKTLIPVCVSGRATRIVGALATIDCDNRASIVMTHEMYKNEIFNDTKKIIEHELELAKKGDTTTQKFAEDYENGDETENVFTIGLREKIMENIKGYSAKLSEKDLSEIKKTCLVFAGL